MFQSLAINTEWLVILSSFLNQSDFSIGELVYERYNDVNESLALVNQDLSNEQLSEVFFELASSHPEVTSLNLSFNQFDEDSASMLSTYLPSLPNLVDLNLSGNDEIDDPGLASLSHALSESSTITCPPNGTLFAIITLFPIIQSCAM